jgi:hypothetical protein
MFKLVLQPVLRLPLNNVFGTIIESTSPLYYSFSDGFSIGFEVLVNSPPPEEGNISFSNGFSGGFA